MTTAKRQKAPATAGMAKTKSGLKTSKRTAVMPKSKRLAVSDLKLAIGDKVDKKNFYVRLTNDNKKFVEREAKRVGISYTAFINTLLTGARERSKATTMAKAK